MKIGFWNVTTFENDYRMIILTDEFRRFEQKLSGVFRNSYPSGRKNEIGEVKIASVEAFLGVPYASAPVGSLRLLPPASPGSWTGVKLAAMHGPACPQIPPDVTNRTKWLKQIPRLWLNRMEKLISFIGNQSEDCLYLNIYRPAPRGDKKTPAVVFIHGDSYDWGGGHLYDGSQMAAQGKFSVVTLNYRLGLLGFLQSGSSTELSQSRSPKVSRNKGLKQGNYALLDIVAALLWLQENADHFGLIKDKITIIGQYLGATLANLLMLSHISSGLFSGVLLMSGSALTPCALSKNPTAVQYEVTKKLRCNLNSSYNDHNFYQCLQQAPLGALLSVNVSGTDFMPRFAPFVDFNLIHSEPSAEMDGRSVNFRFHNLMIGTVSAEGFPYVPDSIINENNNDLRENIVKRFLRRLYSFELDEIFLILKNEYMEWETERTEAESRQNLIDLISDGTVNAHSVRVALSHSLQGGKTFFYNFVKTEKETQAKPWAIPGDDLKCLKMYRIQDQTENSEVCDIFLDYIVSFVRTGDPNKPGIENWSSGWNQGEKPLRQLWRSFNPSSQEYISFGERIEQKNFFRSHQIGTWLRLIPEIDQLGKDSLKNFRGIPGNHRSGNFKGEAEAAFEVKTSSITSTSVAECTIATVNVKDEPYNENGRLERQQNSIWLKYDAALVLVAAVGFLLVVINFTLLAAVFKSKLKLRSMNRRVLSTEFQLEPVEKGSFPVMVPTSVTKQVASDYSTSNGYTPIVCANETSENTKHSQDYKKMHYPCACCDVSFPPPPPKFSQGVLRPPREQEHRLEA
ncbi:neuroligin-4, Y-linked-like isoform X2 [Artemia franciscana]|uniref:neuroligin-4, Y-linked-like isoform X2 n=1 Tax=Artemia franciscana TaxID=6661 RepID=UPI0032DBB60E